jgi:hypothetical protein
MAAFRLKPRLAIVIPASPWVIGSILLISHCCY